MTEKEIMENGRAMLLPDWDQWNADTTDMKKGVPAPGLGELEGERIALADFIGLYDKALPLVKCLENRRSKRKYSEKNLSPEELSYLVWSACGIREVRNGIPFRTYPTGGNTQALNCYLCVRRVEGIKPGLYRHMPLENAIVFMKEWAETEEKLKLAHPSFGSQVTFIWTAVPYRTEYKYSTVAHKMVAMEAGHACQNLCLAAESLGMGCVPIAAYSQKNADCLLGLANQEEEFVIYMAAAGK